MHDGFIALIVIGSVIVIASVYISVNMARVAKMPDMHPTKYVNLVRKHQNWRKKNSKAVIEIEMVDLSTANCPVPHPNPTGKPVVVMLGDSHTQGTYCIDWLTSLSESYKDELFFVNAGINGEQTDQIMARLPAVIACNPRYLFVMAGSNDRLSHTSGCSACAYGQCCSPRAMTAYKQDYKALLLKSLTETQAYVVVLAVPPAEAPRSDPINVGTDEINSIAQDLVQELRKQYPQRIEYVAADAAYQPLVEGDYTADGPRKKWTDSTFVSRIMWAQFLHWVCGYSYDEISQRHGLKFTVDAVHFNTRGANLVREVVDGVLRRVHGRVDGTGALRSADAENDATVQPEAIRSPIETEVPAEAEAIQLE